MGVLPRDLNGSVCVLPMKKMEERVVSTDDEGLELLFMTMGYYNATEVIVFVMRGAVERDDV